MADVVPLTDSIEHELVLELIGSRFVIVHYLYEILNQVPHAIIGLNSSASSGNNVDLVVLGICQKCYEGKKKK